MRPSFMAVDARGWGGDGGDCILSPMFLGIEIGGTKLQLGLGRGDGELLGLWRGTVDVAAGGGGIPQRVVAARPGLFAAAEGKGGDFRGGGGGFRGAGGGGDPAGIQAPP